VNQVRFTKSPKLSVNFNHEILGDVNIHIEDLQKNQNLELKIIASSDKAAGFFNGQKDALMNSLERAGLNITNFKIENSSGQESSDTANYNSQNFDGHLFQNQNDDNGRERRNELWTEYRERMVA
jgi:flagellar hook-length control protein FliK